MNKTKNFVLGPEKIPLQKALKCNFSLAETMNIGWNGTIQICPN